MYRNESQTERLKRFLRGLPLVKIILIGIPLLIVLAVILYNVPFIHERLAWRVEALRVDIIYALNPPDEASFLPTEQGFDIDMAVSATLLAMQPTQTFTPEPTLTPAIPPVGPTNTPEPSPTATITPTPLPAYVYLEGVKYEDQHNRWNYCGPANLSMGLTFWGWDGNRDVVGQAVKPSDKDKNVMPYEMQNFIEDNVDGLSSIIRHGGDLEALKRLLANGYPVIVEKGYYEYDYRGKLGWLGHYQFVTGYDDAKQVFILQDTYLREGANDNGADLETGYEEFMNGWRSFNFVFMVIYPYENETEVVSLLGDFADNTWANQNALAIAVEEAQYLTGNDLYFAWFNIGTSHVNLQQYVDAAFAYDYAFLLYDQLENDDTSRPYRVVWYQTGPYFAYFYSARYQDTINLANYTLIETISDPWLEESLYWRGMAKEMLGDVAGALDDYRASVVINPNFAPGLYKLSELGG